MGARLRAAREGRKLGLRELARKLGMSASALSQIETGKSRPSMTTLFSLARELHVSLDELFAVDGEAPDTGVPPARPAEIVEFPEKRARDADEERHVQRARTRSAIDLDTGVRWERLTPRNGDHSIAFLYVIYELGGSSSPNGGLMSHGGCEFGLVLSGWLEVTVGADTYELGPGDSVGFESTTPHRVRNIGAEPAHAVWFGVGRRDDERLRPLHAAADGDRAE